MKRLRTLLAFFPILQPVLAQETLSLTQATNIALFGHPEISAAFWDIDATYSRDRVLLAPYLPRISLNAYGTTGNGSMIFPSTVEPINYSLFSDWRAGLLNGMFMWRFYSGGRDRTIRHITSEETETAKSNLSTKQQDIIFKVRLAFSDALLKHDIVRLREVALVSAKEVERITRERYKDGKVPEAFVLRATADTARAEKELAIAQATAEGSLATLKEAVGIPQVQIFNLGNWDISMEHPYDLNEALALTHKLRPELSGALHRKIAYELRAKLAKQSRFPEISLMAMGDLMGACGRHYDDSMMNNCNSMGNRQMMNNQNSMQDDSMSNSNSMISPSSMNNSMNGSNAMNNYYGPRGRGASRIGIIFSFPLIDGGERYHTEQEQLAMAAKTTEELRALEIQIESEVASAWANLKATPVVLKASLAERDASQEAYRIALLRYKVGKAILAELNDVRTQLVSAQVSVVEAEAYERSTWAKMQRAIGKY